ncbi:NAD(P)-binding protein [Linderina pennispora]|uniref:NAD(P)-binding protein n=1 Tax=Linderina pennispora TaxID=61395 RepID=A0A1Y1W2S7_9FUNG|nr:NAD(P)-binding protein [Linderina pennispora]ORX67444.1 NAD(P)-binding protein [Linderina pennispora]
MTKLIAITGATGLQGGSVLKSLHATGAYKLRAITRNTSSDKVKALKTKYRDVEWAEADLDSGASLVKAFQGADYVFGVTQFFQPGVMDKALEGDTDAEFRQGKNMVDAAIEAKVGAMIYSSLDSMKQLSGGKYPGVLHFEGKHKIEEYLNSKSDKISPFFVYLGYYMENYVDFSRISPEDNTTVEFAMPLLPTTRVPLVDTANDTGVVVRYIIEHPEECRGKPMEASGGYYEAQEMAKAYTEATGKPARYVQIPYEAVGLDELAQMFKGLNEFGLFGGRTGFLSRGYSAAGGFTTPVQFWKNRNWSGPSSA